jgi:hypothetical protein
MPSAPIQLGSLSCSHRFAMSSISPATLQEQPVLEGSPAQAGVASEAPPQPVRHRISGKMRARIDIDDEIEEAFAISDMLKKVQKRAKSMQKSSKKAKQRLVMKASKLRAEDLERIAVLKRCGLFATENASTPNAEVSGDVQPEPPQRASKGKVQRKVADIISQTPGSSGLLRVLQRPSTANQHSALCEALVAGSVVHVPLRIPTGTPLGYRQGGHSSQHADVSQEVIEQADDMPISKDLE